MNGKSQQPATESICNMFDRIRHFIKPLSFACMVAAGSIVGGQTRAPASRPQPTPAIQARIDAARRLPPDSRLAEYRKIIKAAQAVNDAPGEIRARLDAGHIEQSQHPPDPALADYSRALDLSKRSRDPYSESDAECRFGDVESDQGEYTRALEDFRKAGSLALSIHYTQGAANADLDAGVAYADQYQWANAEPLFKWALESYTQMNDPKGIAKAQYDLARCLCEQKKPASAWTTAMAASKSYEGLKSPGDVADCQLILGDICSQTAQLDAAVSWFSLAMENFGKAHQPEGFARAQIDLAMTYEDQGHPEKATPIYVNVLQTLQNRPLTEDAPTAQLGLGLCYTRAGDLDKAVEWLQKALDGFRALSLPTHAADAEVDIAHIFVNQGRYGDAMPLYRDAEQTFRLYSEPWNLAPVQSGIADIYFHEGEWGNAYTKYTDALASCLPSMAEVAAGLNVAIGNCIMALGHFDEALNRYETGIEGFDRLHISEKSAISRMDKGYAYSASGRYNQALQMYDRARNNLKGIDAPVESSELDVYRGDALHAEGRFTEAVNSYLEGLPLLYAARNWDLVGVADLGLGGCFADRHNWATAVLFGKDAVNRLQSLKQNIGVGATEPEPFAINEQRSFGQGAAEAYLGCEQALARCGRTVEAVEAVRLSETMPSLDSAPSIPLTDSETRWSAAFEARIDRVVGVTRQIQSLHALSNLDPDETRLLAVQTSQLSAAKRDLRSFVNSVENQKPDPLGHIAATQATREIERALQRLPKGTAIVYAIPADDCIDLIVFQRGSRAEKIVPVKSMRDEVRRFLRVVQDRHSDPRPLGKTLYEALIKPIEAYLAPGKAVMWSLQSYLRDVPVPALWDGRHFAVERFQNCRFSAALVTRLAEPVSTSGQALVLGVSKPQTVEDPVTHDNIAFDALKDVPREVNTVGDALGANPILDFSLRTFFAGISKRPALVHIASHYHSATVDDRRSFLVTGDGKAISVESIKQLPESALEGMELVTLSACGTASASVPGPADLYPDSLSTWMQTKGAKAVLASLWPVDDESTASLMGSFYRLWRAHPEITKAGALRQAELDMIHGAHWAPVKPMRYAEAHSASQHGQRADSVTGPSSEDSQAPRWPKNLPKYAHPYYWAPFVLTGNPG